LKDVKRKRLISTTIFPRLLNQCVNFIYFVRITYVWRAYMADRNKVRVSITLPPDVVEWAKRVAREGRYPGVRSLSGLVELLLRREMERHEGR